MGEGERERSVMEGGKRGKGEEEGRKDGVKVRRVGGSDDGGKKREGRKEDRRREEGTRDGKEGSRHNGFRCHGTLLNSECTGSSLWNPSLGSGLRRSQKSGYFTSFYSG